METGYSPQEIQSILWGEVFPALEGNLKSIAGEWAGWTDEWLLEHLSVCEVSANKLGDSGIIKEISRCWGKWQPGFRRRMPETRLRSNAPNGYRLLSAVVGEKAGHIKQGLARLKVWTSAKPKIRGDFTIVFGI